MKYSALLLFIIGLGIAACNPYEQTDYQEYYVVEAYLVANRTLPHIRLSTTAPVGEFYTFDNSFVTGAQMEVRLLATNGSSIEETVSFSDNGDGIYLPQTAHTVLPGRTYQLHVIPPGTNEVITGTTLVPGDFEIADNQPDTLVYQGSEQIEVTMTKSEYPGRQTIYIFNMIAQNPVFENFTPVYYDFYDEETETVEDYKNNSSGILNEASLTENPDGTITVDYPWIGVAFYGENLVIANAIDDNIYDYLRSESVQLGGSTLSPGEIANVITHIDGGLGVFGSFATDTISTYFARNPDLGF